MLDKYKSVESKLEKMSLEEVLTFLRGYGSTLKDREFHCKDLMNLEDNTSYMSSVLGSGLNVINNTSSSMSEKVHQKGKSIIAYVQKNKKHNYTQDEIMFTLGYIELYYKKEVDRVA